MVNPLDADHALGIELQIGELVEQRARARAQGWSEEADRLDEAILMLQSELADLGA